MASRPVTCHPNAVDAELFLCLYEVPKLNEAVCLMHIDTIYCRFNLQFSLREAQHTDFKIHWLTIPTFLLEYNKYTEHTDRHTGCQVLVI